MKYSVRIKHIEEWYEDVEAEAGSEAEAAALVEARLEDEGWADVANWGEESDPAPDCWHNEVLYAEEEAP